MIKKLPLFCLLSVVYCGDSDEIRVGDPVAVVPSQGLPSEVVPQNANNNLDVIRHDGRTFFAFRTAPWHFAHADTLLHIVSGPNESSWAWESTFDLDRDLREPRFLSFDAKLFLYFAVLGTDSTDFEPGVMMVSEYLGPGDWSVPEQSYIDGFIPWRARVVDGRPSLIGYQGGENIYDPGGGDIDVHWITTENGRTWQPWDGVDPIVHTGGGSETDFVRLSNGTIIAAMRNEAGDADGFGSKICRGRPESPTQWDCRADPKKYDSPLMFTHGNAVYLVGRRNLTETGNFDLGQESLSHAEKFLVYSGDYWFQPKRCALWSVDIKELAASFVLDLPSRGDTCFASILPGEKRDGRTVYPVYNYTSPLNEDDPVWVDGQSGPTQIHRLTLSFP